MESIACDLGSVHKYKYKYILKSKKKRNTNTNMKYKIQAEAGCTGNALKSVARDLGSVQGKQLSPSNKDECNPAGCIPSCRKESRKRAELVF